MTAMTPKLYKAVMHIAKNLPAIQDVEAKKALLLAMNRSIYKNQAMLDMLGDGTEQFVQDMKELGEKQAEIRDAVGDLTKMLGA